MNMKVRPGKRRSRIVALVILVVSVMVPAVAFAFPWLDTLGQQWVRCEVVAAEPQRGDNYSSVPWYVELETSNCGTVAYQEDVDRENVDDMAASFEPGFYEFKFGLMSQLAADGYLLDNAAIAIEYRR